MFPVLLLPRRITAVLFLALMSLCLSPTHGWTAQLTLSWVDNATNETGFKIERGVDTGTGTNPPLPAFSTYATVGANATAFVDTTVTSGMRYCYQVSAYNGSSTSLSSNVACANVPATASPLLSVSIVGQGTVSGGSSGINCSPTSPTTCSKTFPTGTQVSLTATPSAGWQFSSWGGSCSGKTSPCIVTIDLAKNVTATFLQQTAGGGAQPSLATIGTFRDGSWFYDKNGSSRWEGCATDTCLVFGQPGDQPVVGVWIAGTKKRIGVFRQGAWYLDSNGDQVLNGCSNGDACLSFGGPGDRAVVGDWDGDGKSDLGIFRDGRWQLDTNNNRLSNECGRGDTCPTFGATGDIPVVGDWNGDGKTDIGTFRDGAWRLDMNNNRSFDDCSTDKCITWGTVGSLPVVGDWNGNGRTNIGVYYRGAWQLDTNGSFSFNECTVDKCFNFGTSTHTPVPR